jgi:hypothetical protein
MPSSLNRRLLLPALLAAAVLLSSCFESPVNESVQLRFLPDGAVVVTSTVELMGGGDRASNPALSRRLAEVRQALIEGSDPWSRRFAGVHPPLERFSWEKQLGEVQKQIHSVVLKEPRDLAAVFGDTSLSVSYEIKEGVAELVIVPGPPGRATRRQREQTKRTLDTWTDAVARYMKAGEGLYRYLDEHPDRARPCLGTLFADLLSDTDRQHLPPLIEGEKERIDSLQEVMQEVSGILTVPEGEDYTPDELSHLVYDPFPGRLTVRLPAPPAAPPEGFAAGPDGTLLAAGPGFWEALRSLEGRWLAPDPVLLSIAHQRQIQGEPLDLNALLKQPRRAEPAPDATEVRLAVEALLQPAPLYRVAFPVSTELETPFHWQPGEG